MNAPSHPSQGLAIADLAVVDFDKALFPKIKDAQTATSIVDRTSEWTGGQPFLTHLIYQYIQQYSAQIIKAEGANLVDEIVQKKVIKNWKYNAAAAHFESIEQTLLSQQAKDALLIAYTQILWHGSISVDALPSVDSEAAVLLRSGLVECIDSELYIANAIYAGVFDKTWVDRQIPIHAQKVSAKRRTNARTVTFSTQAATPQATKPIVARSATRSAARLAASPSGRSPTRSSAGSPVDLLAGSHIDLLAGPSVQEAQPEKPQIANRSSKKNLPVWTLILAIVAVLMCLQLVRAFRSNSFGAIAPSSYRLPANSTARQPASQLDSKALFDTGLEHATSGRWLPMLQQFCSIPASSAYFAPAQQQLENWIVLYPEAIQQAFTSLYAQSQQACPLVESTPN
ncbi:MAG: hypothetical protein WA883_14335 [Phormidesmis sp.]